MLVLFSVHHYNVASVSGFDERPCPSQLFNLSILGSLSFSSSLISYGLSFITQLSYLFVLTIFFCFCVFLSPALCLGFVYYLLTLIVPAVVIDVACSCLTHDCCILPLTNFYLTQLNRFIFSILLVS